jgi:integrase
MRHLGALILADRGLEAPEIMKILRHKNLSTTHLYLHEIGDSTRKAADILASGLDFSLQPDLTTREDQEECSEV